jgi:hypothetical protein
MAQYELEEAESKARAPAICTQPREEPPVK